MCQRLQSQIYIDHAIYLITADKPFDEPNDFSCHLSYPATKSNKYAAF